ncbi:MAG TPA: hypothetical protein VN617_03925 [Rhodoferax sp.]|nr:hypothetical protein [Rhodoferax sp.]
MRPISTGCGSTSTESSANTIDYGPLTGFPMDHFKVVRYILKVKLTGKDTMEYEQDTRLQIKGRGLMHHTDANHFKRVS